MSCPTGTAWNSGKSLASTYKNHPAVIFDLYNEPHDVSWDIWRNGGQVTEKASRRNPAKTYEAVGMQTLLDAVRDRRSAQRRDRRRT